jgi:thiamine biosynthesis protein ThiS
MAAKILAVKSMFIQINGTAQQVPVGSTLAALVLQLGLAGQRLAIELNGEIVPRSVYAEKTVGENDRLEIVQAIGGG